MRDILNDLDAGRLSDPDPVRRAQKQMLKPLPKRFYKEAGVAAQDKGFGVTLDGRLVRTPVRNTMVLPTEEAALLVAGEYGAQGEIIDPMTMPVIVQLVQLTAPLAMPIAVQYVAAVVLYN